MHKICTHRTTAVSLDTPLRHNKNTEIQQVTEVQSTTLFRLALALVLYVYVIMFGHTYSKSMLYVYVIMYGHTYSKSMNESGKFAIPARGKLNRENEYFLVPVRA